MKIVSLFFPACDYPAHFGSGHHKESGIEMA